MIAVLTMVARAIFNLSVILATIPRVNRFLYSVRDDLVIPRISDFELGRYQSHAGLPGEPNLTPSPPTTTDPTTPHYKPQREARLKPWKKDIAIGGQEDKNTSTSASSRSDAIGSCETRVETDDPVPSD